MSLADALLSPRAGDPRPLLTYYDGATGERIELSGVTTANWAAKAANLLRDDCEVEPGSRVAVLLPAHWQTAAVLLAAWWCGAEVVAGDADLVLCDAHRVDRARAANPPLGVVALSLDPFGKGVPGLPTGVVDFGPAVRLHGDAFMPWDTVPDEAPALNGTNVADVLATARDRAAELGLGAGDRVLSSLEWTGAGLVDGLLAVLVAGASLVQVARADEVRLARIAESERVTRRLD